MDLQQRDSIESVLVADFGRQRSRLVLLERIAGSMRFVAMAEETRTADDGEPGESWQRLLAQLQDRSAADLTFTGILAIPQAPNGDGVDAVAICSTLSEPVRVAILESGSSDLANPLLHALKTVHTSVLHLAAPMERRQRDWNATQLPVLQAFMPELVIALVGDDAKHGITRLIDIARSEELPPSIARVIVVADGLAQRKLCEAFNERLRVRGVAPSERAPEVIAAEIAREIAAAFHVRGVSPDLREAVKHASNGIVSRAHAVDLVNRFVAHGYGREVVTIGIDDGVHVHWAAGDQGVMTALPDVDLGPGIDKMSEREVAEAARWLPFIPGEDELILWVAARARQPRDWALSARGKAIEQALTRQLVRRTLADVVYANPEAFNRVNLMIGGPQFARWKQPGAAALTLLDCLPAIPRQAVVDLAVDPDGLMAIAGAIGTLDASLAASVFEYDALHRLGAVILISGEGVDGEIACRGELRFSGEEAAEFAVAHGGIAVLPLGKGETAEIALYPDERHAIGEHGPGEPVILNGDQQLHGGSVGIILDARPRELVAASPARTARVADWLEALGVRGI